SDQRAGFRIELAEAKEIGGKALRQDREIALHMAGRKACGCTAMFAAADHKPCGETRGNRRCITFVHRRDGHCETLASGAQRFEHAPGSTRDAGKPLRHYESRYPDVKIAV